MGFEVSVYNFGHNGFFSLQERWELERLIRDGFVPDLAIFIDGLNDLHQWHGQPHTGCQPHASDPTERWRKTLACRHDEWCWPVQRLVTYLNTLTEPTPVAETCVTVPP